MLSARFKNAWRGLAKNRALALINISGLAIGLGSLLLIALYVFDELTFDGQHKQAKNIYRIMNRRISSLDGQRTV